MIFCKFVQLYESWIIGYFLVQSRKACVNKMPGWKVNCINSEQQQLMSGKGWSAISKQFEIHSCKGEKRRLFASGKHLGQQSVFTFNQIQPDCNMEIPIGNSLSLAGE